jgi:hypothetical protein
MYNSRYVSWYRYSDCIIEKYHYDYKNVMYEEIVFFLMFLNIIFDYIQIH